MSVSEAMWLDLVWRALGESDRTKKDDLLRRAHALDAVLQPHPAEIKSRKR